MSSLRRALVIVQPLFIVLAFVLLGVLLRSQWDSLWTHKWRIQPRWVMASGLFIAGGWLIEVRLWQRLLELVGGRLNYWPALRIWFSSAIVRYVPGNVWQPLSLTVRCREQGIRPEATLASLTLFQAILLMAVGPIAAVYLATWGRAGALSHWLGSFSRWSSVVVAIPVLFFVMRPQTLLSTANFVLAKLGREPLPLGLSRDQLIRLLGISLLAWAFLCAGFSALAGAMMSSSTSFWEALPHLAAAYPIAYVAGFLSLLTPGGLVVREGMLFLLLAPVIGRGDAIIVALGMRVLEISLEALVSLSAICVPTIWSVGRRGSFWDSMRDHAIPPHGPAVIALMIGEVDYMSTLNRISAGIVERAVAVWRETPGGVLICESAPMAAEAMRLGVAESDVVTALPQPLGHTTRLVALWLARSPCARGPVRLVTHAIHARRAIRIFAKVGIVASAVGMDLPFDREDPDWKLRSAGIFRVYNMAAHVYCVCRRWV